MRKHIVDNDLTVLPESLMPDELPEGIDQQTALVAIVLALASDGATLEHDGLKPNRAREGGPLEQNEARELALNFFPEEAGLRKVGMDVNRFRLMLYFDFPQAAERLYGELLEELIEQSGWDVLVMPQVNQQALALALDKLLPEGAVISKSPSYYMDKREVQAEIVGMDSPELATLREDFLRHTDFRLIITEKKDIQLAHISAVATGEQLEINHAYALLRQALEPLGMYKSGLKQGQIVLSFISPQLGERYSAEIRQLAKQIGYTLTIHPHPNQQKILEVVKKLAMSAGWTIAKGPSIFVDRAAVGMSLSQAPSPEQTEAVIQAFEEQTGYTLEIS